MASAVAVGHVSACDGREHTGVSCDELKHHKGMYLLNIRCDAAMARKRVRSGLLQSRFVRDEVFSVYGLRLGDPLPAWSRRALFCRAYSTAGHALVVKLFHRPEDGAHEWSVATSIGANASHDFHDNGQEDSGDNRIGERPLALVPTALVGLPDIQSPTLTFRGALVTPMYACTLDKQAVPMDADGVLRMTFRIWNALRFMHWKSRLHCDVKAANIFMDDSGDAWLGDFGVGVNTASPQTVAELPSALRRGFGTTQYQCSDADVHAELWALDKLGLAITALEMIGLIPRPNDRPPSALTVAIVTTAAEKIVYPPLREEVLRLCRVPVRKRAAAQATRSEVRPVHVEARRRHKCDLLTVIRCIRNAAILILLPTVVICWWLLSRQISSIIAMVLPSHWGNMPCDLVLTMATPVSRPLDFVVSRGPTLVDALRAGVSTFRHSPTHQPSNCATLPMQTQSVALNDAVRRMYPWLEARMRDGCEDGVQWSDAMVSLLANVLHVLHEKESVGGKACR